MNNDEKVRAYQVAQRAIADLKSAILAVLKNGPEQGLRNVDIGKSLGIYAGHERHEGHIPRVLLAALEHEGVVVQNSESKLWKIQRHGDFEIESVEEKSQE